MTENGRTEKREYRVDLLDHDTEKQKTSLPSGTFQIAAGTLIHYYELKLKTIEKQNKTLRCMEFDFPPTLSPKALIGFDHPSHKRAQCHWT